MIETTATIANAHGIHCRPSTVIVKEMSEYEGEIVVSNANGEADLHSVFGLLALALLPGDELRIRVSGPHEEATAARVRELFETHFDFPPRVDGQGVAPTPES